MGTLAEIGTRCLQNTIPYACLCKQPCRPGYNLVASELCGWVGKGAGTWNVNLSLKVERNGFKGRKSTSYIAVMVGLVPPSGLSSWPVKIELYSRIILCFSDFCLT
jgi:hypothetical protein